MKLEELKQDHFKILFEIAKVTEPHLKLDEVSFYDILSNRTGFVLVSNDATIVGHVTFSDYRKDLDVIIHCSVLPEYQKRWLTKFIYKQIFDYAFIELNCKRATGFSIISINDMKFHERLGFRLEGIQRNAILIGTKLFDLALFGMLPTERRW